MTASKPSAASAARRLARVLRERDVRLVLAESCTCGQAAGALGRIPGISAHFCGSAVTYRDDTKYHWLGVGRRVLRQPGAVSEPVARQMASGALERTPEADWAAAITGHLGPDAPAALDGLVLIGLACRSGERLRRLPVERRWLTGKTRATRQREAVLCLLEIVTRAIETCPGEPLKERR